MTEAERLIKLDNERLHMRYQFENLRTLVAELGLEIDHPAARLSPIAIAITDAATRLVSTAARFDMYLAEAQRDEA